MDWKSDKQDGKFMKLVSAFIGFFLELIKRFDREFLEEIRTLTPVLVTLSDRALFSSQSTRFVIHLKDSLLELIRLFDSFLKTLSVRSAIYV